MFQNFLVSQVKLKLNFKTSQIANLSNPADLWSVNTLNLVLTFYGTRFTEPNLIEPYLIDIECRFGLPESLNWK